MRTRFGAYRPPAAQQDPRVVGTQVELDGLVLRGGVPEQHVTGAWLVFTELEGWWEPTASSGETTARTLAHGGWDNRAFRGPRYITVRGIVWAETTGAIEAALDALASAIPLDERRPFVVRRDGTAYHVMARQEDQPEFAWMGTDTAEFDIQLSAADHRRLAGDGGGDSWRIHGPVALPSRQGGLRFPLKFPIRSDGTTTSGRIVLDLGGTAAPNTVVDFHGPVVEPGVLEVGTGRRLWFAITLTPGQVLSVDLNNRSVLLNGVSRRGTRRGEWIDPKRQQLLEFATSTTNLDARMSVRTQETRL